jgi:prepilin-type N-terminal cleavage/methylation domain-containing protein
MLPAVHKATKQSGFTLIDLMIAMAVLAVVASIAVPAYVGYISTARLNTMEYNMRSLRALLEDERLETGSYGTVGATLVESTTDSDLSGPPYRWEPDSNLSEYSFTVSIVSVNTYDAWAIHTPSGTWRRCDNRMSVCCDGSDATPTACP